MTNAIGIKATDLLLDDDGEQREIASIKGRWVKLDDGSNVSRAQAAEWRQMYLDEMAGEEEGDEEEEDEKLGMSGVLAKYRNTYTKVAKADGRVSMDKGDDVATALRDMDLGEVLALADIATKSPFGTHLMRYASLNVGSQRMNAGNRIRALVRKGEVVMQDLLAELAAASDYGSEEDV